MADYATLTNIKTRLQITSTAAGDDAFISSCITRASAIIDQYTDNHFTKNTGQTRKYDIPTRNPRRLLLDDWLISCTSVTNGNGVVIPSTEYILEDYNNPPYYAIVLKRTTAYFFMPDNTMNEKKVIAVLGDWGWWTVQPDDITEACERLTVQIYKSRRGENMTASTVITPAGVLQTPRAMSKDIQDLLDPYRKSVLTVGVW
jgi:hypothetical protein